MLRIDLFLDISSWTNYSVHNRQKPVSDLSFIALMDIKMSITEKSIYDIICDCDYLTIQQIADKIGRTTKTVYRAIKSLKDNGYVAREGSNINGYRKILK